jgi:hypothetical protein
MALLMFEPQALFFLLDVCAERSDNGGKLCASLFLPPV